MLGVVLCMFDVGSKPPDAGFQAGYNRNGRRGGRNAKGDCGNMNGRKCLKSRGHAAATVYQVLKEETTRTTLPVIPVKPQA